MNNTAGRERRRFDRVLLPEQAQVYAVGSNGARIGKLLMLGRGGMLVAPAKADLAVGSTVSIFIVDPAEDIRASVRALVRYHSDEGTGFEFDSLSGESAVDVGVIIGKFYSAERSQQ